MKYRIVRFSDVALLHLLFRPNPNVKIITQLPADLKIVDMWKSVEGYSVKVWSDSFAEVKEGQECPQLRLILSDESGMFTIK